MNEEKWRRFLENEMDKDMEEIDGILAEMDDNPETKDMIAPEEIHDKLMAQIEEDKKVENRLTDEEKELIRLGKVYKKRCKWNKALVLVAAVVCVMAIGVTSMGGPERVLEKFSRLVGDREQDTVDTDDERIDELDAITEADAYEQIEEEFGFYPVRLDYLPENMAFETIDIDENLQSIGMYYEGSKGDMIAYMMYLNYRTSSVGLDVEDTLLDEYEKDVNGVTLTIKEYSIEERQTHRYVVTYEYQNVFYHLQLMDVESKEVEKVVENLYFCKK